MYIILAALKGGLMKTDRVMVTVAVVDYKYLKSWAKQNDVLFKSLQIKAFKELADKLYLEEQQKQEATK